MESWQLILTLGLVLSAVVVLVTAVVLHKSTHTTVTKRDAKEHIAAAQKDVEHIFNEDFREQLRKTGIEQLEKIIQENATFLQQDLRLTSSQLSDFMKQSISKKLQEEFAAYDQSIADAKQQAIDSIQKTRQAIDQQREVLGEQMRKELDVEKQHLIQRFEQNMAEIINHYVLTAIGDQISLDDQLEYILSELENNKAAIVKDMQGGA